MYEQLWQLADGDCTPEQARRLHGRIAEDPAWRAAWAGIQRLDGALAVTITGEEAVADFSARVLARIGPASRRRHRETRLLGERARSVVLAVCGLFAAVAAWSAWTGSTASTDFAWPAWLDTTAWWAELAGRVPSMGMLLVLLFLTSVLWLDVPARRLQWLNRG